MKKKNVLLLIGILVFVLMFALLVYFERNKGKEPQQPKQTQADFDKYEESVKKFEKIEVSQVEKMITEKQEGLVYIGRVSCPYCVGFAPKLAKVNEELKAKIAYLEATGAPGVKSFFEKNKIEYVPTLLYIKDGKLTDLNINENIQNFDDYKEEDIKAKIEKVK